ncbi:beta-1,3-galactosyl-O-glycosyl-glycoprotein beta-1,6-N-acetylglucosaminyltransferase 4-like isoform X2 [Symsagittifera roscoffensis]
MTSKGIGRVFILKCTFLSSVLLTTLLYFVYLPLSPKQQIKVNNFFINESSSNILNRSSTFRMIEPSPNFYGLKDRCERLYSSANVSEDDLGRGISVSKHIFSLQLTENGSFPTCEHYLSQRRREGFYNPQTTSEVERRWRVAYGILVYKNVDQVEQLLMSIYRQHNFHCIHVDSKATPTFKRQMERLASCFPHDSVFLAPNPVDVQWARFSLVQAELACMGELLRRGRGRKRGEMWDYFINLTGEEFPLVTNMELATLLDKIHGVNLVDGPGKHPKWERDRLPAKLPPYLAPFKSSTHVGLCREAVEFILESKIASELLDSFSQLWYAEEAIFAILQYNKHASFPCSRSSKDGEKYLVEFSPRYKQWSFENSKWCPSGFIQRHICMVGVKTLPQIVNNYHGVTLAVNKFPWHFEPLAWDCLNVWHHSRVSEERRTGRVSTHFLSKLNSLANPAHRISNYIRKHPKWR